MGGQWDCGTLYAAQSFPLVQQGEHESNSGPGSSGSSRSQMILGSFVLRPEYILFVKTLGLRLVDLT